MKTKRNFKLALFAFAVIMLPFVACNSGTTPKVDENLVDSTQRVVQDTNKNQINPKDTASDNQNNSGTNQIKSDQSTVLVYNFYVTNRCASCIAIEDATTKTLNTYFAPEVKSGRIKRQILNVDDDANSKIAEKYQVFGSGIIVARVYKGKETSTDFTGEGFKYAKNKEERFIEILKSKITEYLK
jgi:hypothetical protein